MLAAHFKKYLDFYLLNYLLLIIYVVFFVSLHIDVREGVMFTTVDSITYLETSKEFYKIGEHGYSHIRPFLFPLLILLIYNTLGTIGLWLMNVLFWFGAINFIFFSVKKINKNRMLSYLAALLMAINFSYVGLTLQCLTEVTTILMVSMLVFLVVKNLHAYRTLKFFHSVLFLLALLTVVKPVFLHPTFLMLFVVFPIFYLKLYLKMPRLLLILLLAVSPILYQVSMMKMKYNVFEISQIGRETFRPYLLAQGVIANDGCSIEQAREKTNNFSGEEVIEYLINNKLLYLSIYLDNLQNNMNAFSSFLLGPRQFFYPEYVVYMGILNTFYYYLHLIFAIPVLIMGFLQLRKKQYSFFVLTLFCWIIAYYIFFTSPISFGEGDRLVITALPLWVFLYVYALSYFLKYFKTIKS